MIKAAIIGSGNIGIVLMIKMLKCAQHMVLAAPASIRVRSSSSSAAQVVGGQEDMIVGVAPDMLRVRAGGLICRPGPSKFLASPR